MQLKRVLGVHGVLRAVQVSHLRTSSTRSDVLCRVDGRSVTPPPSPSSQLSTHCVHMDEHAVTATTLGVMGRLSLRRSASDGVVEFDGLLDRLLLVQLVPFRTCWGSASGPECLASSLLYPPSTRQAVRSHCGFSKVSPDPSVRCTYTIEASRRLDAMVMTMITRPVLPSHSLCLLLLQSEWALVLFSVWRNARIARYAT